MTMTHDHPARSMGLQDGELIQRYVKVDKEENPSADLQALIEDLGYGDQQAAILFDFAHYGLGPDFDGCCGIRFGNQEYYMEMSVGYLSDAHQFWINCFKTYTNKGSLPNEAIKLSNLAVKKSMRKINPQKQTNSKKSIFERADECRKKKTP